MKRPVCKDPDLKPADRQSSKATVDRDQRLRRYCKRGLLRELFDFK